MMSVSHVLLVTILWGTARVGAGEPPPSADAGGSLDSGQLLRLIVSDVTANIRPLVDQIASRIEGMDARLISFESRLNALDSKQSSIDARLAGLVSRGDSMNDEFSARLEELTSLVESGDNELRSQLEEVASQGNYRDTEIGSRLEEVAAKCNCSDIEQPSSRLDSLTSRVDGLPLPRDCSELPSSSPSGTYLLQPGSARSGPPVTGYCDQDTDGGGWTVFQRRADIQPRQDFNHTWPVYREGFGSLDKEFWWGLENLWRMTGLRDRQYQLRVDLADFEGGRRHAVYQQFRVASEADGYRLSVREYSGNARDSMSWHNGQRFSTWDRDQDSASWGNCAKRTGGGWWFNKCYTAHLNGLYLPGKRERQEGVVWHLWRGHHYSLKETDMKLRPVNAD